MEWIELQLPGADLRIAPDFLRRQQADAVLDALSAEIPWQCHRIRLYGRELDSPRLSCWMGEPEAVYTFSRTRFEPLPWTPTVWALKSRVEAACGGRFNSVLANLYRDGADSMGWHADDEPELGPQPVIASLSLGAERRFCLRERPVRGFKSSAVAAAAPLRLAVPLPHGSLLRMAGATQARYQHALPKSTRALGPRLNLTFRLIRAAA
ncbi:alpha-ketoglutarate-dependent dioxygenase AlkB family protein [Aquimonas sp.]|jgi:alkylated DNA repair dioxygenase AlkB|uniref:alpha-ketoglutarate-dependent dioxygenase AlkB family protein n=1 Tax=Aquimonas sp. TaxID=1872588 RepID=UPI0037BE97A5